MRDKKKRKKGAQKKGGENSPVSPPLDPPLLALVHVQNVTVNLEKQLAFAAVAFALGKWTRFTNCFIAVKTRKFSLCTCRNTQFTGVHIHGFLVATRREKKESYSIHA